MRSSCNIRGAGTNTTCAAAAAVAAVAVALMAATAAPKADAHCYLMEPVSRNFLYTTAFQDWHTFPNIENCPHCLQSRGPEASRDRAVANTDPAVLAEYNNGEWPLIGSHHTNGNFLEPPELSGRHGVCGDPVQTSEEGSNVYGQVSSTYPVIGDYVEGSVIEMKVAVPVYHWGHFEFFLCNTADIEGGEDSVVTQECFNNYPLTRAPDDGDASPIDPNFPGRYYVQPPCREDETDQSRPGGAHEGALNIARYQLPEGVTCDRCVIRMIYYTSHVCTYPGYDEFNPPSWPGRCAPSKGDWFDLGPEMCGGGPKLYPEEFFNCADIMITSDGNPASAPTETGPAPTETTPTPSPAPERGAGGECSEESEYYEECGGSTCCEEGYECEEMSDSYSECRPIDGACAADWTQCGGGAWDGPTCCWPGASCEVHDQWWSQCEPEASSKKLPRPSREDSGAIPGDDGCKDPVAPYEQCGHGSRSPTDSKCCRMGYECQDMASDYSECRPVEGACTSDWGDCKGGSMCCWPGAECVDQPEGYSLCVPEE